MKKISLINKKFGLLTVVAEIEAIKGKRTRWLCKCDCGKEKVIQSKYLKNGDTKSCGCLNKQSSLNNLVKAQEKQIEYHPYISSMRYVWHARYSEISVNDFHTLSQLECYYCGIVGSKEFNILNSQKRINYPNKAGVFTYNGLDRIDSSKDHNINNVVPACWICNATKRERSLEDFQKHIKGLVNTVRKDPALYRNESLTIDSSLLYTSENKHLKASVNSIYKSVYHDISFSLDEFYKLTQLNCFYCNVKPSNLATVARNNSSQFKKDTGNFIYSGLDRIDSKLKHDYNNVVPCCKFCNWGKSNMSIDDFYKWIDRLKAHNTQYIESYLPNL